MNERSAAAMDVARRARRGVPALAYTAGGAALLVVLVVWALLFVARQSSAPLVDQATLVTDVARRGTLVRSVSAQGVLAPERVRVAAAAQPGIVNAVFVRPGSIVAPGSVIAQLQNPALESAVTTARSALQVAQANVADAQQQARAAVIVQESGLSDARAQMQSDALQAHSYAALHRRGLLATLQYQQARIQARKSAGDVRSREAQVRVANADAGAKIAAAQAQSQQAAAQLAAAREQVSALTIRSAVAGVVQSVDVDPGTSVAQSAEIARIADTRDLKAVLQVADSDVHQIAAGMLARVDTGSGVMSGRVARVAPAAQDGTVAVDVAFAHALPYGARPDSSVDGTIEIARIPDAVSIARPAGAADGTTMDLFKLVRGGKQAVRVRVRLGEGSADRVQVLSGIAPGDTVIVSDMSAYANDTTLRLR